VKLKPENKFRPEWDEFFSDFNFTTASCVYNCDDQSIQIILYDLSYIICIHLI